MLFKISASSLLNVFVIRINAKYKIIEIINDVIIDKIKLVIKAEINFVINNEIIIADNILIVGVNLNGNVFVK